MVSWVWLVEVAFSAVLMGTTTSLVALVEPGAAPASEGVVLVAEEEEEGAGLEEEVEVLVAGAVATVLVGAVPLPAVLLPPVADGLGVVAAAVEVLLVGAVANVLGLEVPPAVLVLFAPAPVEVTACNTDTPQQDSKVSEVVVNPQHHVVPTPVCVCV